jgi:Uma2 family endonuclease
MAEAGGLHTMTKAILRFEEASFILDLSPLPDLSDEQFFVLCQRNDVLRLERAATGEIIIMPPAGGESGYRNAHVTGQLVQWAKADGTGVVFDSSTGFVLPNGATRGPDAAWVRRQRLVGLLPDDAERFLRLAPDFVVELRSPSDRLPDLQLKMAEYIANGVRLGWLIDPYERSVDVCRPGRATEHLAAPDRVTGDPELSGLVLELGEIWRGLRGVP